MDELFSFIRQLDNINEEDTKDLHIKFIELIKNLDIEDSKKCIIGFDCDLMFGNNFITLFYNKITRCFDYIEILINKKYYCINYDCFKSYGIADYENFNDIIIYDTNTDDEEYMCIDHTCIDYIDHGSINWLLDHKPTKSARN